MKLTLEQEKPLILPALLKAWNEWDVRVMVLLSLLLQITVSLLGKRRKYTINLPTQMVLWFAYLSADWIAIATLGKLSSVNYDESDHPTTNVLKAFWAPLLILHLGGPDTITAYSFEDNGLWKRHLLVLVVKSMLAVYVICLSWTTSLISFLNIPLVLAAIAKYAERIWCLALISSQKRGPMMNIFNFYGSKVAGKFPNVVGGYCLFYLTRPDVNNYLSQSVKSSKQRMQIYQKEIRDACKKGSHSRSDDEVNKRIDDALGPHEHSFDIAAAELELIFDVTYTKSALIYTRPGCFLRFTSFACCLLVMLVFLIRIMMREESAASFPRADVHVTAILLVGTIALELYAVWIMLSSNWAILVTEFHHSRLISMLFSAILRRFPFLLNHRKKLDYMGQFDLLEYCLPYKKTSKLEGFHFIGGSAIIQKWQRSKFFHVKENARDTMKELADLYYESSRFGSLIKHGSNKMAKIMGSAIGGLLQGFSEGLFELGILKWTTDELDLDHSIIVWHLATSVCYHDDHLRHNPKRETYKAISNYMMYLLVMRPALILPTESKSFFVDHASGELKEILTTARDTKHACEILGQPHGDEEQQQLGGDHNTTRLVSKLVKQLKEISGSEDRWKMVEKAWMKLLVLATCKSSNVNHVKQLGEGAEFFSLLWLLTNNKTLQEANILGTLSNLQQPEQDEKVVEKVVETVVETLGGIFKHINPMGVVG